MDLASNHDALATANVVYGWFVPCSKYMGWHSSIMRPSLRKSFRCISRVSRVSVLYPHCLFSHPLHPNRQGKYHSPLKIRACHDKELWGFENMFFIQYRVDGLKVLSTAFSQCIEPWFYDWYCGVFSLRKLSPYRHTVLLRDNWGWDNRGYDRFAKHREPRDPPPPPRLYSFRLPRVP